MCMFLLCCKVERKNKRPGMQEAQQPPLPSSPQAQQPIVAETPSINNEKPPATATTPNTNFDMFSNVAIILLESTTFLLLVLFNISLLLGAIVRAGYISLAYLIAFLLHLAWPSKFNYFRTHVPALLSIKTKPGERLDLIPRTKNALHSMTHFLFCTPHFLLVIVVLLLASAFGVTQIVFQIMFRTGVPSFYTNPQIHDLLHDIGIVKYVTCVLILVVVWDS